MPLEPPDSYHLSAAIGWLELGNADEAGQELIKLSPASLEHIDVLDVRWAVCAAKKDWDGALQAAELLLAKVPDRVTGWIHRAYALRRVRDGGLERAWDALRPAFEKFPKQPIVPYNLACYSVQLGRLDEGWDWLQKAIVAAGDANAIKRMALADADLHPLWQRIRDL